MNDFPEPVAELVAELAAIPDAVAVALGGSKALGCGDTGSDWDIGLYYRGTIDLTALHARGVVYPPGSWGRVMNGGAWLRCGDERVDVILRDLTTVEHWTQHAEQGEFEVDHLLGYLAGVPTYLLTAELASCHVLHGSLPAGSFPPKLATTVPPWWRFCRSFSLDYARMHARRGHRVGVTGQVAKAILEEAHAIVCEHGRWACNEKRLLDAAGLAGLQRHFGRIPCESVNLVQWVDRIADRLGAPTEEVAPWSGKGRGVNNSCKPRPLRGRRTEARCPPIWSPPTGRSRS
jgi:hypothetical protein